MTPPPRRVPTPLWLKLVLGSMVAQTGWMIMAAFSIGVRFQDKLPRSWAAVMVLIGCSPLFAIAAFRARRQLQLLRRGVETTGKLVDKSRVQRGKTHEIHYTFQYVSADGEQHFNTTISDSSVAALEDNAAEPMVYDPERPDRATPLDHLPGSPAISDSGELVARNPRLIWISIAPSVAIVALILLYVG